eukprot:86575-Pleurochrysis_carterae.AAC.1
MIHLAIRLGAPCPVERRTMRRGRVEIELRPLPSEDDKLVGESRPSRQRRRLYHVKVRLDVTLKVLARSLAKASARRELGEHAARMLPLANVDKRAVAHHRTHRRQRHEVERARARALAG